MIKKFCDRCFEEITPYNYKYPELEFKYKDSAYDIEKQTGDLCGPCRRKIIDYIELKPEFYHDVNK